jgi:hypothetical protein
MGHLEQLGLDVSGSIDVILTVTQHQDGRGVRCLVDMDRELTTIGFGDLNIRKIVDVCIPSSCSNCKKH